MGVINEGAERVKILRASLLTYKCVEILLSASLHLQQLCFILQELVETLQLSHKSPQHHDCSVENCPYYVHFRAFICIEIPFCLVFWAVTKVGFMDLLIILLLNV